VGQGLEVKKVLLTRGLRSILDGAFLFSRQSTHRG
jgi:hypothetical protein